MPQKSHICVAALVLCLQNIFLYKKSKRREVKHFVKKSRRNAAYLFVFESCCLSRNEDSAFGDFGCQSRHLDPKRSQGPQNNSKNVDCGS